MTGVVYADVLFIVNTYITYAILLLTAVFLHIPLKRMRILLSGALGGIASLAILLPFADDSFLGLLRLVLCAVLPLTAFSYGGLKKLLKQSAVFLSVNMMFAGIMLALWYFVSPTAVYYNTGIVYFDIDTISLVLMTAVCYFAVKLFRKIIDLKAPKNTIFDVYLEIMGDEMYLRGFLDTGNSLKDPFTASDVVVVSRDALEDYFPIGENISSIIEWSPLKIRYLPCSTVSGSTLMPVFRCDSLRVKGVSGEFTVRGAVIGITDEKIKKGAYQALLPAGIFQNNYSDRRENNEETQGLIYQADI